MHLARVIASSSSGSGYELVAVANEALATAMMSRGFVMCDKFSSISSTSGVEIAVGDGPGSLSAAALASGGGGRGGGSSGGSGSGGSGSGGSGSGGGGGGSGSSDGGGVDGARRRSRFHIPCRILKPEKKAGCEVFAGLCRCL